MRRGLVAVTAALAAATWLLPAGATGGMESPFTWGSSVGGAVEDLATGAHVTPVADDERDADASVTVLPYRAGARYRIPLMLSVDGARDVRVLDVRVWTAPHSVARPAGAVWEPSCCGLVNSRPFAPFSIGAGRPRSVDDLAMVGLDVELCCRPAPAGWVEKLAGFQVTYRWRGVTRTERHAFPLVQTVVVRA